MADCEDRTLTLNDCRLHLLDWGNAGAPPLLLVHGLTQHAHMFDGIARHLRGRFHCIALDVRGRGDSEWAPPETYNLVQYAKDVVALLDALGIEATDYIGTSMGGLTAMALGHLAPQRLRRTVINDIGPELAPAGLRRIAESVARRSASFLSLDALVDEGLLPFYYWLRTRPRAELLELARWGARQQADGSWVSRYDPAVRGAVTPDTPEALKAAADFLWPGFRALPRPVLLIRGAESDLLTRETVAAMRAARADLRVAEVPGASHAPLLDEPEAMAAIDAFLN